MADQQFDYENVPVAVRRREQDGVAEFGVVINGKFFGFGGTSLGGFDADIQEAADAQAAQVQAQAAQPQPTEGAPPGEAHVVPPEAQPQ